VLVRRAHRIDPDKRCADARTLGHVIPAEDQYDETCALAAALMSRPAVRSWVSMSYPILLVDEAQDLSRERSAIIAEASTECRVLLAYDEFQCLNPNLRPMPPDAHPGLAVASLHANHPYGMPPRRHCRIARCGARRTESRRREARWKTLQDHADAGTAQFRCNMSGERYCVAWPRKRSNSDAVASGRSADGIIGLVRAGPLGRYQSGPFPIEWESSDEMECNELWERVAMPERCSTSDAIAALRAHMHVPAVKAAKEWVARQRRVLGVEEITSDHVRRQVERKLVARSRYAVVGGWLEKSWLDGVSVSLCQRRSSGSGSLPPVAVLLMATLKPKADIERTSPEGRR
jgi:hypothetical protein